MTLKTHPIALDWQECQRLLEKQTHFEKHEHLFLQTFFSNLQSSLSLLSTQQCIEHYPALTSLLSLAAHCSYLDATCTENYLRCLLHLGQLDQTTGLEKSERWCLQRLRQKVITTETRSLNELCRNVLACPSHSLPSVLERCLPLARLQPELMEGLIQRALAVTDFCFSDRFLSHLVHHPHFLFTTCSAPTTIDFLLKLPDLYELYLLQSITDGWGERYERLETLGSRLEKDPWVRLAQRDPRLRNALWTHLSQHAVQWADWRLVRCVQSLVGRVAMSSLQTPDQQRSLDWCVRLQTQVWDIFGAFRTLLERTCEPWTEKRNAQLEQIHSLLYPALDHRQDLSFLDFKAWFQTSHQNWKLENVLKERFNANGMVIACFVTAFLMSESIQTDQLERWLRGIFTFKGPTVDWGVLYLFLDCLHVISQKEPKAKDLLHLVSTRCTFPP